MAAPKNNAYWRNRSKHGRNKEFADAAAFEQAWLGYFKWVDANPWHRVEQLKKPFAYKDSEGKTHVQTITHIPTKRPYTEAGFIAFHSLGRNYITQLGQQLQPVKGKKQSPDNKARAEVLAWALGVCYADKFEGSVVGAYNASVIMRDLGLRELQKHEHSGPDGKPIETSTTVRTVNASLDLG